MSRSNLRSCSKCGREKDAGSFYKSSMGRDGLRAECKECSRRYDRSRLERSSRSNGRRYARARLVREEMISKLGGVCSNCCSSLPSVCMDFHHVGEKKFKLAGTELLKSRDVLDLEASKCVLLCSNCHRIEHWCKQ